MKPFLVPVATFATAIAVIALPLPLLAQGNADPEAIQAGNYALDSAHTLAQFSVNHFGINDFFGTFPDATGTLTLDPKNIANARLDVSLPMAKVSTTNAKLDEELVSADWFDAAKYPTARFISTKVSRTGKTSVAILGNLTLHGVTRPVTLNATFNAAAVNPMKKVYTLGFKATGTIKRSEFGVAKYVPMVSDETVLTITAAFEKKAD